LAKIGEVLFMKGDTVTVEGGTGGVSKGDPLKIEGASSKAGIYIKIVTAGGAVTDIVVGTALEDIAEGALGPMFAGSPVIWLTGKATVTIGAWVGPSGTAGQLSDVDNSAGAIAFVPCVGVAWKGVSADTDEIPVQWIPCVFAKYAS
jgi:hypothetical protein